MGSTPCAGCRTWEAQEATVTTLGRADKFLGYDDNKGGEKGGRTSSPLNAAVTALPSWPPNMKRRVPDTSEQPPWFPLQCPIS